MDSAGRKRLKYFANLSYPTQVCVKGELFVGYLPDLPECYAEAREPQAVYAVLEAKRRASLRERVDNNQDIPLPNSHLEDTNQAGQQTNQNQTEPLDIPHLIFALA